MARRLHGGVWASVSKVMGRGELVGAALGPSGCFTEMELSREAL